MDCEIEASAGPGFEIEAADGEKKIRNFTMTAYTGGRLQLANFYHPVIVDLSGLKVSAKSRPILRDHDASQIVGHTSKVEVNAGSIRVQGAISAANEHAREVEESADNGFPWQASIGAYANRMVFVDRGETVEVNGRKFAGPVYVARQSTLGEVSFVALGADDNTSATVAAGAADNKGEFTMGFEDWLKAKGFALNDLNDSQVNSLKAMWQAEQNDDSDSGDGQVIAKKKSTEKAATGDDGASSDGSIEAYRQSLAVEAKRVNSIRRIMATADQKTAKIDGEEVDLEAHAIEQGWDAKDVELHVLRANRPKAPAGHVSRDEMDSQVIEAALLASVGQSEANLGKWYKEKTVEAALSKKYRAFTLHALMGAVIRAAGDHYHGSYKSDEFIRATYTAERKLHASGFSTLSLANILENVAHKEQIAVYEAIETQWQKICRVSSMSDFKVHSRYRLDSEGSFKKVGASGELKHVGLSDAKYTNQLDTYGAIIALTRQQQINDDLDAFLDMPRLLTRMAVVRLEEAVFVLLLSNPGSFFSTGNNNLLTSGSSALGLTSLTTAKQSFQDQVDSNGKPIMVSPAIILGGTTLDVTIDNLLNEAIIIDGTSTGAQPRRNAHAGTLQKAISPYLNNTSITDQDGAAISGQSDTQWYLFANPMVRAAINVGFLNGQRMPTLESGETSFNTLGMEWRSFSDFGVGMEDTVAAVKSAGS